MASSGGLSCPDSDDRMDYYNMSGIPHIVFDGVINQVGAGSDAVDGVYYSELINQRLAVSSPMFVFISDYDYSGLDPYVTVAVQLWDDLASIADTYIRIGVCENDLSYNSVPYHNILRDMLPDQPLTIDTAGQVQEVTLPLVIGPGWDTEQLWLFAFVQRDSDKLIYNAGSSHTGDYAVRIGVEGNRQAVLEGPTEFGPVLIMNVGIETDTLDLTLDQTDLPEGWDAFFTMDGVDYTSTSVTLAQLETAELTVTMTPGESGGSGRASLIVHSQSGQMEDEIIEFAGIIGGTDLLLVSADGPADYAYDYYAPAIATTGKTYAVWDRDLTAIEATTMSDYEAIIWMSGDSDEGLDETDRTEIGTYLAGGGKIFLSGKDLAWGTFVDGGAVWMANTLRCFYRLNELGTGSVTGVEGDPISGGLDLSLLGGEGAGNYAVGDGDVMRPFQSGADGIYTYVNTTFNAGNRVDYNGYKVVFLGFGMESIASNADRETLMQNVLAWLSGATPVDDGDLPGATALLQNVPNPFNPQTNIFFDVSGERHVSIELFDVRGRQVDTLVDQVYQVGRHSVLWDGRDAAGREMPSGTYFVRMLAADETLTSKIMLVR